MDDKEAKEAQEALVNFGLCETMDEAAHFLADAGDIDSTQHADLLSKEEAERIYG